MIKYTHAEPSQITKLKELILSINNSLLNKANCIREMLYQLKIDNNPTLIMAKGGSKVAVYYLQVIIESLVINVIKEEN